MSMNRKTKSIAIVILCLSVASFGTEPVSISHSINGWTVDDSTATLSLTLEIVNNTTTVLSGAEISTAHMGPLRKRLRLISESAAMLIGDIPAAGVISVDYTIESAYALTEEAMDHIPIFWEVDYIDETGQPQMIDVRSKAPGGEPEVTTETASAAVASLSGSGVIEEWVARFDGEGCANAVAVDASGNVYVTGVGKNEYVTIKYDSSGDELWVARYNGRVGRDYAEAIAVDSEGNVYVTGRSYDDHGGTNYDYATIKYDASGNEQWVRRYNGPGNGGDSANDMAVDASGNVYVTGGSAGSGTRSDYATIKYDASGNQQWVARYSGPAGYDSATAMALDLSGNVYVTGLSRGSGKADYATVKYDSSGNQQWVARYNGPLNNNDAVEAIAVDGSGNVYVTGGSIGGGYYYNLDYATIKYDSSGNELWVARYDSPWSSNMNSWDWAYAVAVDTSGNVYVTGGSGPYRNFEDYATIKYDASGNELWVARYDGPGNYTDEAFAMALDGSGNVYVTGQSTGIGTYLDYATIKYDSSGNELWVARYDGPGNWLDEAYAMAVDASGNVYVTGASCVFTGGGYEYATIKYSSLVDPPGAIEALIGVVISLNLQQGITNSLDAKLSAALNALDDVNTNNDVAAINTLEAFINAVEAQSGDKIQETDADGLIQAAVNIINMLTGL